VEAQQREMLDAMLSFTLREVPYYAGLGIAPRIGDFPVMRKEFLDRHFDELIVPGSDLRRSKIASGSGTTRIATRMLIDKESYAWHFAGRWRSWALLGLPPATRSVLMAQHRLPLRWKRLKAQLGEAFTNRFLIAVIAQDEATTRAIHRRVERLQPIIFDAMTSTLEAYVLWCEKLGLRPPKSVRMVRPSGENVSAEHLKLFRAHFGCAVRSSYGAREFGSVAGQCEHSRYHLFPECCYYEVLRDDGSIGTTGSGRILITTLHNHVMPLIRYDPGDLVTLTDEPCPCGLPLPVMSSIEGRTSELLHRPDGKTISSQALHQLIYYLNQNDWRVTQDSYDHLDVQIVPMAIWGPDDELKLRERIESVGGGLLRYDLRLVENIPMLSNGKSPNVINATDRRY
jgi:phenylacetate-CoA ligase